MCQTASLAANVYKMCPIPRPEAVSDSDIKICQILKDIEKFELF